MRIDKLREQSRVAANVCVRQTPTGDEVPMAVLLLDAGLSPTSHDDRAGLFDYTHVRRTA